MSLTQAESIIYAEELLRLRELSAAIRAFEIAETFGADPNRCSAGRWMAYMLQGNLGFAWAESDKIRGRGTPDPHGFWQGEDLCGKRVILRCLHGLGDAVQFFRYTPALRSLAESLVIEVPPSLLELAPSFAGIEEVITWGSDAPSIPPHWDVQVEINELPYFFRTTAEELPFATKYLQLDSALLEMNKPKPNEPANTRIGLVWASGSWKPSRSVPLLMLRPLLNQSGCEFWNLQGGPEREQWSKLSPRHHLHASETCGHSVLGLAATIAQLDLVITTDTLAAHLAGALGVPTWVMLERAGDWRWQHQRADSPWYPSLRLFRQERDADWNGVITRMASELSTEAVECRTEASRT